MGRRKGRRGGTRRIRWDRVLGRALAERGPVGLQVETEVELFRAPPRLDQVLLLSGGTGRTERQARILSGLWAWLPDLNVTELKTVTGPYAPRDLQRLYGKAHHYFADACEGLTKLPELGMGLLVPGPTPALAADLELLGWELMPRGGGYHELHGCGFTGFVVYLDEVADTEQDDLIRCISQHKIEDAETADWLVTAGGVPEELAMANISGFNETMLSKAWAKTSTEFRQKLLSKAWAKTSREFRQKMVELLPEDELLASVPPKKAAKLRAKLLAEMPEEEALLALSPKKAAKLRAKLLAEMPEEEALLALPPAALRLLPKEAFAGFSPELRRKISRKLAAKPRH